MGTLNPTHSLTHSLTRNVGRRMVVARSNCSCNHRLMLWRWLPPMLVLTMNE